LRKPISKKGRRKGIWREGEGKGGKVASWLLEVNTPVFITP